MSVTNASGSMAASTGVKDSTSVTAMPDSAISARRSSSVVIGSGARSGCKTSAGCGSNVQATAVAPPARVTAASRIARWARWTPSNTPSATTLGRASGGKDSTVRTIRMQDPDGPQTPTLLVDGAHTDERALGVVYTHEAGRRRLDVDRLSVTERAGALRIEARLRPPVQRGGRRHDVLLELTRARVFEIAPAGRVRQRERPDAQAAQTLHGAADAERVTEIGGGRAHLRR